MKRTILFLSLLTAGLGTVVNAQDTRPAAGKAYVSDREIHLHITPAESGLAEPVLIDRATGLYRFAWRDAQGVLQWGETRSTGLPAVDSASAGLFLPKSGPGFVVVERDANRLAFVTPSADPAVANPALVPSPAPGPARVAAGRFHHRNETELHEIALLTAYNTSSQAHRLDFLSLDNATFPTPTLHPLDGEGVTMDHPGSFETLRHPSIDTDILLLSGDASIAGPLTGYYLDGSAIDIAVQYIGSAETRFEVAELFAAPDNPSLLIWHRGEPVLHHAVLVEGNGIDGAPLGLKFLEPECVLPFNIGSLVLLEDGADPARILVVSDDGRLAVVLPIHDSCPGDPLETLQAGEQGVFLGALPDGKGGFTLFTGVRGGASRGYMDFQREGDGSYTLRSEGLLPELDHRQRFPNLIGFDQDPFLVPEASAFAYYRYQDWTLQGTFAGNAVEAVGQAFLGETEGLGQASTSAVGSVAPGVGFLLPNQVAADISVAALAPVGSHTPDSVSVSPAPGTYNRSIRLDFSTGVPDGTVYFRLDSSGPWNAYDPGARPALFQDTTVQYYARSESDPNRITAVRTAIYTFSQPFHRFDSNRDGVPDFVRDHFGLDPFGPVDSSGNGITDLEAILRGLDPLDPDAEATGRPMDFGLVFDAEVYPHFPDPKEAPGTAFLDAESGVSIEAHKLTSNRAGRGVIGSATGDPSGALLERLDPAGGRLFFTASTPSVFPTNPVVGEFHGHELLGLFAAPDLTLPVIEYSPSGQSLAEEVDNWRNAALKALEGHERVVDHWNLTPESTFVLALMEHSLSALLADRNGENPAPHTLVPHRRGDNDRARFTREKIESLTRPLPGARDLNGPLYDLIAGRDAIIDTVENGQGVQAQAVRALIYDVFQTRTLHHDPQQADLPRPLDAFRGFLENGGELPGAYQDLIELSAPEIEDAYLGALAIAEGAFPERRLSIRVVEIVPDTFDAPCRNVIDRARGETLQLLNARGEPYRFPSALRLPEGTRLEISGFPLEIATGECQGEPFEVLAVHLIFLPSPIAADGDGNLLPDEWEQAFFGTTGLDPFADSSGNGYSNLQHYLRGSDPRSSSPISGVEPADLSPPTVEIRTTDNGEFEIEWAYPYPYIQHIGFLVEESHDMNDWQPLPPISQSQPAADRRRAVLPGPQGDGTDAPFFRLRMEIDH